MNHTSQIDMYWSTQDYPQTVQQDGQLFLTCSTIDFFYFIHLFSNLLHRTQSYAAQYKS